MDRSIGSIIDELITVNIKCFMLQDREVEAQRANKYEEAGLLGEQVIKLNRRRSELQQAIDAFFFDTSSFYLKTYGKDD